MKVALVVAALCVAIPIAKGENMNADESEILKLEHGFLAAWKAGDAHGAAAVFAEDGLRVGAFGDVSKGRAEIEASYRKLFSGPMKGASADWKASVHLVTADVAIAQGPLTIHAPDGRAIHGYAVDVWRKKDGRWWLIEAHPKFFPPPPAAPAKP